VVELDSDLAAGGAPAAVHELAAPAPVAKARGAIDLRGLTKRYGEETVVDAIALSIPPGEFFSLLGPSGSGKTTTLMMVAGFVRPNGGAILLDGEDLAAEPPQKRGFGMVFQNYAIFPHAVKLVVAPFDAPGCLGRVGSRRSDPATAGGIGFELPVPRCALVANSAALVAPLDSAVSSGSLNGSCPRTPWGPVRG
jgi:hypothetical protein